MKHLNESDYKHITKLILEGHKQGEVCTIDENYEEVRGSWTITKNGGFNVELDD